MNIITLQSDYHILSLSRLSAPVQVVEVPVIDIRVVEGMEGVMEVEEEFIGKLVTEEVMSGTVMEEELPMAVMVEEEPMAASWAAEEEPMVGVFDPEDC